MSYISIARNKHKIPILHRRQASRYFLCTLAFWAFLNIFRSLLFHPLLCTDQSSRKNEINNEFWRWAESGVHPSIKPCLNFSETYKNVSVRLLPKRYMMVVVSGDLDQQRNQIMDAVIVARILRAALIVPVLQFNQIWGDESEFSDIFDETHFKEVLKDDVVIISSLPPKQLRRRRVRGTVMPFQ